MRSTRVYALLILVIVCMLLAVGYAQTANARTGQEAANSQDDSSLKPSNPGERTAPDALPNSRDNPSHAMPVQKIDRLSPTQGATPVNPPAADQNSPSTEGPQSQAPIPQSALFELFFNNMGVLNQVADNDDKAGNHMQAAAWRRYDQEGAGLNDAEGDLLREIVLDCLRMLKDQDAKFRALAEKERAQMPPGVIRPASAELTQTFEGHKKIISDHIERLKEALGDVSFNKLDAYIHSTFHAQMIEPKLAPPSTTGKK